jgi:hypothetical protein
MRSGDASESRLHSIDEADSSAVRQSQHHKVTPGSQRDPAMRVGAGLHSINEADSNAKRESGITKRLREPSDRAMRM